MKSVKVNLSENMTDYTIRMYHDNIRAINEMKLKIQVEYDEKLDFLRHAQSEFQTIESQMKGLDENILTITKMINAFKGIEDKEIVVKGKNSRPEVPIKWFPYINAVIKEKNMFLSFDEIWAELGKNAELVALADKTVTKFKNMRTAVFNSVENHIERKTTNPMVSKYQDKYGLPAWVNHNGKLTSAARAKEFIGIEQPKTIIPINSIRQAKRKAK